MESTDLAIQYPPRVGLNDQPAYDAAVDLRDSTPTRTPAYVAASRAPPIYRSHSSCQPEILCMLYKNQNLQFQHGSMVLIIQFQHAYIIPFHAPVTFTDHAFSIWSCFKIINELTVNIRGILYKLDAGSLSSYLNPETLGPYSALATLERSGHYIWHSGFWHHVASYLGPSV